MKSLPKKTKERQRKGTKVFEASFGKRLAKVVYSAVSAEEQRPFMI